MRNYLKTIAVSSVVFLSSCATDLKPSIGSSQPYKIVKSINLRWSKSNGPDFDVYLGEAIPPESGGVGLYSGMHPSFEPQSGSTKDRGVLGDFQVLWYRTRLADWAYRQDCLCPLPSGMVIHAWVYSNSEENIPALERELGRRPEFSKKEQ